MEIGVFRFELYLGSLVNQLGPSEILGLGNHDHVHVTFEIVTKDDISLGFSFGGASEPIVFRHPQKILDLNTGSEAGEDIFDNEVFLVKGTCRDMSDDVTAFANCV